MHLSIIGDEDVHLTGNPQITFFKAVYKRHTNFAVESILVGGTGDVRFGGRIYVVIPRIGDLIHEIYLDICLPDITECITDSTKYATWVDSVGHALIKYVDIEIGGCIIDRHYGQWLNIWSELTMTEEKRIGYNSMIGKDDFLIKKGPLRLHIPLQFWFNRNIGLALPLIALEHNEVRLHIAFRNLQDLIITNALNTDFPENGFDLVVNTYIDYIFLETEERRQIAYTKHEILIEQVQLATEDAISEEPKIPLNFRYPVKELIWVIQDTDKVKTHKEWFNYSDNPDNSVGDDPLINANLLIDGINRFSKRDAKYFRQIQPYQHHTRIPTNFIYLYSFAREPEKLQPSGTLNFGKVDTASLNIKIKSELSRKAQIFIYATNYNILRIEKGMAGLMYI